MLRERLRQTEGMLREIEGNIGRLREAKVI